MKLFTWACSAQLGNTKSAYKPEARIPLPLPLPLSLPLPLPLDPCVPVIFLDEARLARHLSQAPVNKKDSPALRR